MGCTGSTGSTILLKRSCTAGATPDMACLTVGELALNLNDGKIFARGCTTGQFFTWSTDGSTADDIVTSVQGMTGDVTFADLVGVCSVNGATGAVSFQFVASLNGKTGALNTASAGIALESLADVNNDDLQDGTIIVAGGDVTYYHAPPGNIVVGSVQGATGAIKIDSGLTLNGKTLGIDNTAHLHVAGISASGGITAGGNINVEGSSIMLGLQSSGVVAAGFQSDANGVTICSTNTRQVITLGGGHEHLARMTLFGGSKHHEIFQADYIAGVTIGANIGISGGICGAGAEFTGITSQWYGGITCSHIDVKEGDIALRDGGTLKLGSLAFGNHTSYSFPTVYAASNTYDPDTGTWNRGPKILYQPSTTTGLGSDHPMAFEDLGRFCVLNVAGATGTIKCGTGLTMGGPVGLTHGGTLGIDPTAVLTVAGISSSGGITFSDGTNQTTAAVKQRTTATFNIHSSTGITGAKTQGLYHVPWAATIKFVGVKGSTGDFVATLRRAGATSFFSDAASSSVLQTSVGVTYGVFGATASSASAGGSFTMPAESYLYLDVVQNNGGSTAMNFFVDLERD